MKTQTIRTLNTKVVNNSTKIKELQTLNNEVIKEAITMVNDKINEIKVQYDVTDRKAIKVIQTAMFEPKNKEDKLAPKMKQAIKVVTIAHKRKVYSNILWNELSTSKIEEILNHLTVKEIQSITNIEDVKPLLDSHKTRKVTTTTYEKK